MGALIATVLLFVATFVQAAGFTLTSPTIKHRSTLSEALRLSWDHRVIDAPPSNIGRPSVRHTCTTASAATAKTFRRR